MTVGDRREEPDERPQHDADQLDRAREDERVPLGVGERERLGHELAEQDGHEAHEERHDEQREDVSRAREPEGDEHVGERVRDARAGEGGREEADERDAELDRREQRTGPLDEPADAIGAPVALVAELAQAAAPDRDERDLGRHEHAVHDDEQGDDEELGQGSAHQSTSSPSTAGMVGAGSVAGSRLDVTGRRIRAGTPTAILPGGTSRVTTEPAPV